MIVGERCGACGAKAQDESGACVYCGTLVHAEPPPTDDRRAERLERFDALADHPSFDKWMTWRPAEEAPPRQVRGAAWLVAVLVSVALFATIPFRGETLPLAVIAAAGGAFVFAMRQKSADAAREATAVGAYPALVVAKRLDVQGGGGHARTDYFLTLEYRTGRRAEYVVDGAFYGLVAEDDVGVAYVREDELVTFKHIAG